MVRGRPSLQYKDEFLIGKEMFAGADDLLPPDKINFDGDIVFGCVYAVHAPFSLPLFGVRFSAKYGYLQEIQKFVKVRKLGAIEGHCGRNQDKIVRGEPTHIKVRI